MVKKIDGDGKLTDMLKKVISTGVGAAFMTEEAIRGALKDLPLSKDMIQGLVQNAKGAKEDIIASIKEELKGHLKNIDPAHIAEELIKKYDVEVNATLKFKPKAKAKKKADS